MRGSRPHNPNADHIVIDEIWFYKEKNGSYYLGNVKDSEGKPHPVRAHVYVWEKHNGKVPYGYHIHHKDHNTRNNNIENLEALPVFDHLSAHGLEHSEASRENLLKSALPKAVEWHKSEMGSEWHKSHYDDVSKEIWMQPVTLKCEVCGKEYQTVHSKATTSRFCSNNCKAKFRRMSGVDNETRNCIICGSEFTCNKYSKQKVCGNNDCIQAIRVPKIAGHHHRKSTQ